MRMRNTILGRDVIGWLNLLFGVALAISVTLDIYRNNINIMTIVSSFISGMAFTTWLWVGISGRSQEIARKCLEQSSRRVMKSYEEYSKLVDENTRTLQRLKEASAFFSKKKKKK